MQDAPPVAPAKAGKKGTKAAAVDDPNKKRPSNKGKKHSTVYQKNALYGAYRFWRKKSEDLKARGMDVSFDWKELFEFFDFSKTTGFKVIRDADTDPASLLKRDDSGKVETRGRKPKMGPEQIAQVENILDGKDPFQEGIEWKLIARQLGLEVHKHTVRRTMQARRKSLLANTPAKPIPAPIPATPLANTTNNANNANHANNANNANHLSNANNANHLNNANNAARRAATANMIPMHPQLQPMPTAAHMIDPSLSHHAMMGHNRPQYTEQEMSDLLNQANQV